MVKVVDLTSWGLSVLLVAFTCACSSEPAAGGPSASSTAGGGMAHAGGMAQGQTQDVPSGGTTKNDGDGGKGASGSAGMANVTDAKSAASSAAEGGAGGVGGADVGDSGGADDCELDAFVDEFKIALAQSTAPSGCAIPMDGAPTGQERPISATARDFVATASGEPADAFTFSLETCNTPTIAACGNVFDKFAGVVGGNLQILAHPFSERIDRCSAGVELSVWTLTKGGATSGRAYCLMGSREGQAMGYCVFDAGICPAKT
jgi:hypothetical protein